MGSSAAAAGALVGAFGIRVVRLAMVEPAIDVLLVAGTAVLAQTLPHAALHEPYRVLDELHGRAEGGRGRVEVEVGAGTEGGRAVEVGVYTWVGGVRLWA